MFCWIVTLTAFAENPADLSFTLAAKRTGLRRLMIKTRIRTPDEQALRCSFCNKALAEVRKLIAGPRTDMPALKLRPTVFICNECIEVCNDIIRAENEPSPTAVAPPSSSSTYLAQVVTCKLCGMQLPLEHALVISERGFLCPGCSGEVEAALTQKRETSSE